MVHLLHLYNTIGSPKAEWIPLLSRFMGGGKNSIQVPLGLTCPSFLVWQDTERFRARSQELERKLLSKEQELEQLVQKQKGKLSSASSEDPTPSTLSSPFLTHFPPALYQGLNFFQSGEEPLVVQKRAFEITGDPKIKPLYSPMPGV